MQKPKTYYFIDIHLSTKKILDHGEAETATHHGNMEDPEVHRMFLPVGQYNKLVKKLAKF